MKQKIKVSIQVAEYQGENQLSGMLKGILSQHVGFECEVNIVNNSTVSDLNNWLDRSFTRNEKFTLRVIEGGSDHFGIDESNGEYLAFCCFGDIWNDSDKLNKQVKLLDGDNHFIGCVHDIAILNTEGVPFGFAEQQAYKRRHFCMDRFYTWSQLQRFLYPGAISTLVCRNVFSKELLNDFIKEKHINPVLRLYGVLAFEGVCCYLYDEQMAERYFPYVDDLKISTSKYKNFTDLKAASEEVKRISRYARQHYNIEFDCRYRFIQLAAEGFQLYKSQMKGSASFSEFMDLYDQAYAPCYDLPAMQTHFISEQKQMFDELRYSIFCYVIENGQVGEDALFKYITPLKDEVRIEYILRSYRKYGALNKSLRQKLINEAADSQEVRNAVRRRLTTAPFRKVARKGVNLGKSVHRKFKKIVTLNLRRKGFSAYMANEWYDSVRGNLLSDKTVSLSQKIWCYRRGFMPWRMFQYGLTEDNYQSFLSDRDYMYLHQINNSYKKWIEDKMTLRYVLDPFKEYLPKYYFQIIRREGYTVMLPLMDCPVGYGATFDELFRLLRKKGNLALKAASGTHGIGFYKMSYQSGMYYMNNKESSEYEIRQTILNFKSYYVVTEFINMHDQIKNLYAGSVNTLRIMMINRDGYNPQILDAYMRIGSKTTGTTDNVAFGGVFCKIDIASGRYGNAEQSKNHVLVSCPRHPDTEAAIEGIIPHWELIKEKLVTMSKYMGQLEYLGFDVVCTPESFVILEINSHQDLHRYIYYDKRIKQFYFDKLKFKKKLYKL